MVDEFAKHAKIQRKINKLRDELTNQSKSFRVLRKEDIKDFKTMKETIHQFRFR